MNSPGMNTPGPDALLAEVEESDGPAPVEPPVWAARLAVAGRSFVAVGVLIVLGVAVMNPFQNVDVLCAGVTLAVAGGVLCSIASPADRRDGGPPPPRLSRPN